MLRGHATASHLDHETNCSSEFRDLQIPECPFSNLPEKTPGRWVQGLTAAKMKDCRWLKPVLVGQFEFVEWTPDNHLRHSRFVALRDDKPARDVHREPLSSSLTSAPAAVDALIHFVVLLASLFICPTLHSFAEHTIDSLFSNGTNLENGLSVRQREILAR